MKLIVQRASDGHITSTEDQCMFTVVDLAGGDIESFTRCNDGGVIRLAQIVDRLGVNDDMIAVDGAAG